MDFATRIFPFLKRVPPTLLWYVVFGVLATLVEWGAFAFGEFVLRWHYVLAATFSFLLATATNFLCNKYLNFKNQSKRVLSQLAIHTTIGVVGLGLTALMLFLFIDRLGLHPMVAKVICSFFLLFYSYPAHKHITFNHEHLIDTYTGL